MPPAARLCALLLLFALSGCRTAGVSAPAAPAAAESQGALAGLDAVLWMQSAAEARALALATFAAATRELDAALADPGRSALGQGPEAAALPPALIADIDETLLDNSEFQGRLVAERRRFERGLWLEWIRLARAPALPGAAELARHARERGVTLFYVTNREADEEAATRANLASAGFPLPEGIDVVLARGERPEWKSDKSGRRAEIARTHRVLLLLGDDLNDFVDAAGGSLDQRRQRVESAAGRWGRDWFVLANPSYGSWAAALVAGADRSSAAELARKLERLRSVP